METQNMADTTRKSSWTEHEAGNQEKWKDLVDSGRCRNVWKQICPQCGKEFYTMNRFRKYCHLSDCRDQAKQERNEKRSASIIRSIFAPFAPLLLFPSGQMPDFAATPADKRRIEKRSKFGCCF